MVLGTKEMHFKSSQKNNLAWDIYTTIFLH